MSLLRGASARRDFCFRPKDVLALRHGPVVVNAAENRAAAENVPVVHQNEAAEIWNTIVIVEYERGARLNRKLTGFVAFELLALARRAGDRRGDRRRACRAVVRRRRVDLDLER